MRRIHSHSYIRLVCNITHIWIVERCAHTLHTYTPIHTHIFTLTHTLPHTHSHSHTLSRTHIHTHAYSLTLTLTLTHTYAHMHTHIYTHKYTHTYTFAHFPHLSYFINSLLSFGFCCKDGCSKLGCQPKFAGGASPNCG